MAEEGVNAFPSAHGLIYNWRNRYRSAEIFFSLFISLCLYILGWIEVVPWWTIPRFCNYFPALPKGLRWLATHTSDMCLKNIKVHYLTSMLARQPERERERWRDSLYSENPTEPWKSWRCEANKFWISRTSSAICRFWNAYDRHHCMHTPPGVFCLSFA